MEANSSISREVNLRRAVLEAAHTVVIKVGTNVLTTSQGHLDLERVRSLVEQVWRIRQTGRRVALVSSGAIGAGIGQLGLDRRPTDLPHLQAAAAVGQSYLMAAYESCFRPHGCRTAQILLTASDLDSRTRYLNVRNTLLTLFEWDCIPIINENDTVSTAEIKFGDNDHLAALVTNLLHAPLLILLTNVEGLYRGDPSDPKAEVISVVERIDESITNLAGTSRSPLGTGGMKSKLRAAQLVTSAGEAVWMAHGGRPRVLDDILDAKPIGTLFLASETGLNARQRWIGLAAKPRGRLVVDAGARRAVEEKGRSLLAIGVVEVVGNFSKGDVVVLQDTQGVEFARGLSNYSAADARRIQGMRSEDIVGLLGPRTYEEVIHRDNLVLTRRATAGS
ncbi:MAG: glutamate 5-kinase [Gemmatales bacterium]|nr:glutamate 5-kinase [Gemmatales bacterium]MDW8388332.1 glutamate 5-kinase [Gemmatales bacterium]